VILAEVAGLVHGFEKGIGSIGLGGKASSGKLLANEVADK
jgi:hypothetical protein